MDLVLFYMIAPGKSIRDRRIFCKSANNCRFSFFLRHRAASVFPPTCAAEKLLISEKSPPNRRVFFKRQGWPSAGNACDRRRWRREGAGVGAAVEKCPREARGNIFRAPQEGKSRPYAIRHKKDRPPMGTVFEAGRRCDPFTSPYRRLLPRNYLRASGGLRRARSGRIRRSRSRRRAPSTCCRRTSKRTGRRP